MFLALQSLLPFRISTIPIFVFYSDLVNAQIEGTGGLLLTDCTLPVTNKLDLIQFLCKPFILVNTTA